MASLNTLPPEIIALISRLLVLRDRLSLVSANRKTHLALNHLATTWSHLHIEDLNTKAADRFVVWLLDRRLASPSRRALVHTFVARHTTFSTLALDRLFLNLPHLTHIDLRDCLLSALAIRSMLFVFAQLNLRRPNIVTFFFRSCQCDHFHSLPHTLVEIDALVRTVFHPDVLTDICQACHQAYSSSTFTCAYCAATIFLCADHTTPSCNACETTVCQTCVSAGRTSLLLNPCVACEKPLCKTAAHTFTCYTCNVAIIACDEKCSSIHIQRAGCLRCNAKPCLSCQVGETGEIERAVMASEQHATSAVGIVSGG